jgi:hypothetical protein
MALMSIKWDKGPPAVTVGLLDSIWHFLSIVHSCWKTFYRNSKEQYE